MADPEIASLSSQAKERLESIRASLKEKVDPADYTPFLPQVAYKLLIYREAALWRSCELADATLTEAALERGVSSTILVRSLYESAAMLRYVDDFIVRTCQSDDPSKVDDTVMKLLMASRWEDWEHQSINIMTAISKIDRELPGGSQIYAGMSEVAHPNWLGTAGAFSKPNVDAKVTYVGNYPRGVNRPLWSILNCLNIALLLIQLHQRDFTSRFVEFASFCQKHYEQRNAP